MNVHMWEHRRDAGEPAHAASSAARASSGRRAARSPAATRAPGGSPSRRRSSRRSPRALAPQDLRGERVLVTAGPTREAIDPVRYLSNRSSGKMGYAIARAARRRGAEVTLVSGPTALAAAARRARRAGRRRAAEMRARCEAEFARRHHAGDGRRGGRLPAARAPRRRSSRRRAATLAARARADRRHPARASRRARGGGSWSASPPRRTTSSRTRARKLREKRLDLIVANDVTAPGAGFGSDTNVVRLLDARRAATRRCRCCPKDEVAGAHPRLGGARRRRAAPRRAAPRALSRSGRRRASARSSAAIAVGHLARAA